MPSPVLEFQDQSLTELPRRRLEMEGGVKGVEPCGLELEVHNFDNSKRIGMGLEEVATHNGMDTIIDKEFHELGFKEQLQKIDDELARFDNNVARL